MIQVGIGLATKLWDSGISRVVGSSARAVGSIGMQWRSLAFSYLGAKGVQMLARMASEWNELAQSADLSAETMARLEQAARAAGLSIADIKPLFADLVDEKKQRQLEAMAKTFDSVAASAEAIEKHSAWMRAGKLFKAIGERVSDAAGGVMVAIMNRLPTAMRMSLAAPMAGNSVNMGELVAKYNAKESKGGSQSTLLGMGLNPLQQIGGFTRGPTDRMVNHLRNIEGNTKATAQALGQRNAGIGGIGF